VSTLSHQAVVRGLTGPFHNASHHSGREYRILDFARLNAYHVATCKL